MKCPLCSLAFDPLTTSGRAQTSHLGNHFTTARHKSGTKVLPAMETNVRQVAARGSDSWVDWCFDFAKTRNTDISQLIEQGLAALAQTLDHPDPPRRLARSKPRFGKARDRSAPTSRQRAGSPLGRPQPALDAADGRDHKTAPS